MRREMSSQGREMPEPALAIAAGAVTLRVILRALSESFSAERPGLEPIAGAPSSPSAPS